MDDGNSDHNLESPCTPENSGNLYHTLRRHIPEDNSLHQELSFHVQRKQNQRHRMMSD
jgi:predicted transposase YbfD/YdcC